jgi:hypothetical protein
MPDQPHEPLHPLLRPADAANAVQRVAVDGVELGGQVVAAPRRLVVPQCFLQLAEQGFDAVAAQVLRRQRQDAGAEEHRQRGVRVHQLFFMHQLPVRSHGAHLSAADHHGIFVPLLAAVGCGGVREDFESIVGRRMLAPALARLGQLLGPQLQTEVVDDGHDHCDDAENGEHGEEPEPAARRG